MLELLFLVCTVTRICNEDLNNGDKLLLITHREKLHSAPTAQEKHTFSIWLWIEKRNTYTNSHDLHLKNTIILMMRNKSYNVYEMIKWIWHASYIPYGYGEKLLFVGGIFDNHCLIYLSFNNDNHYIKKRCITLMKIIYIQYCAFLLCIWNSFSSFHLF